MARALAARRRRGSLLREIEYYTPNAPEHAHITSNYDHPAVRDLAAKSRGRK